jgi:tetratricopeptide (TPR) repeat protein
MLLISKDPIGALKDLDSAIANNYKIDPVYTMRAQVRREQGDQKGALADYDEAIKLNPDNPRSYSIRANLLIKLENEDRALSDLNYLLTWYETDPTKRPKAKAATQDDKPIKEQSDRPKTDWKGKDDENSDAFSVHVALESVNESPADKEMVPVIAEAYVIRGLIQSSRGNRDAAIADFTKSIRVSPTYARPFYFRALELVWKGDLAGALSDANKTIEFEPLNGNVRVEHGVILLLQGKTAEAQVDFDMLLKSDPVLWQKRIDERTAEVRKKLQSLSK